jgi:hypothetical protein
MLEKRVSYKVVWNLKKDLGSQILV